MGFLCVSLGEQARPLKGLGRRAGLVEEVEGVLVELEVGGLYEVVELVEGGGAGDGGGDAGAGHEPGEGDAGGGGVVALGDLVEGGEDAQAAIVEVFLDTAGAGLVGEV